MNNFNFTSSISISSYIDNEEASLKSYNFNNYNPPLPIIIGNNYEFNIGNTSNLHYYDTNDISQDILTKNENITEVYKYIFKPIFHEENDNNNNNQVFNPLANSNIIIEIKNINFTYEDKIDNQNKTFNIFNSGDYDNYSTNIIDETLNGSNKKCKKIKKVKKIFTQFPKKINKKKKNIEHRKDNADNIRKKIKVKFHKLLKMQLMKN